MEEVLDVYASEHSVDEPLICIDEASKQLVRDEVPSLPLEPGHPVREDSHYERRGTPAVFLFFNPVTGQRRVSSRDNRTRIHWAAEIQHLLDVDDPETRKVTLVCDNLNVHSKASLYEAFSASEAHPLARRLEIVYTPRNGSWLNVAEIELSVLGRQCFHRRIGSPSALRDELSAWQEQRNAQHCRVHWRFTIDDARIKLHRLYPQL